LLIAGGVVVAGLGVGVYFVARAVQRESARVVTQVECAEALKTRSTSPSCAKLTPFELAMAREIARCMVARDAAVAAGADPEKACAFAPTPSAAGSGAAP
jgi:hypothetical protein